MEFSVILPTYNRAKFIKNAIHSVLNQSFIDFELIIIDDGSTDHTREIVTNIKSSREKEIKALDGAFPLFEKSRLESVGYFDPDFFLYAEEFEWCYRIRKSGLALKYYDDIKVHHLEERSSISKDWNTKQRYLSGSLLFKKTHGTLGLFLYLALHFVYLVTNARLMWKLDSAYRSDFIRSQKYFWGLSGKFLTIAFNTFKKPLKLTHIK